MLELPGQGDARLAERTGNRAGRGVAQDAPRVVGEQQAAARRRTHRQRADDAAAHADAVCATKEQQGEETRFGHGGRVAGSGGAELRFYSFVPAAIVAVCLR
ncbi:MAG: hypothetical protein AW12_00877 [Candidatus Accumulibacter sp. BA-94]|nr:MAG: hypothetical protein AW12_00877 [Candidatus Accumulibacter sp. BA-94]